jgi:preprotein translocase subunit SecD
MNKNIRWKVLTSIAVLVIFSVVGVYPIVASQFGITSPRVLMDKQLKLGLDLKGGVHLVLRVKTDDALRIETESEMERVREALRSANIATTSISAPSPTEFRVEGVSGQDQAFRQATTDALTNFDRNPGAGGIYSFVMKPNVAAALREESVEQARQTIERRVNELGVAEPSISRQGADGDQILVQLPGVSDVNRAKAVIQSTGLLELKIVENGPFGTREEMLVNGQVPEGMEILPGVSETNQPAVSFTLTPDGSRKFGTVTEQNIGRQLAIIVDGRVQSAPRIDSRITTDGRISGAFTQEEVQNLSLILRSGALPASMDYLQQQVIGPTLGADSIRSGITASIVGLVLIMIFMLIYYRLSGVNAIVALIFNLIILLGLMAYIGAVMTLPGIAGFVLTMGIGVDSNVLIFERIKEELEAQRGVRAAVNAGFSRVFLTLLDTHISALIAALFLIQFGTGPIRGFAYTLIIGLASNLFTSTFVSKTLFELVLSRRQQVATLSI